MVELAAGCRGEEVGPARHCRSRDAPGEEGQNEDERPSGRHLDESTVVPSQRCTVPSAVRRRHRRHAAKGASFVRQGGHQVIWPKRLAAMGEKKRFQKAYAWGRGSVDCAAEEEGRTRSASAAGQVVRRRDRLTAALTRGRPGPKQPSNQVQRVGWEQMARCGPQLLDRQRSTARACPLHRLCRRPLALPSSPSTLCTVTSSVKVIRRPATANLDVLFRCRCRGGERWADWIYER